MYSIRPVFLLVVCGFFLSACHQEPPQPWIPVLEKTSFTYLNDEVTSLRLNLDQAVGHLNAGEKGRADEGLAQVRSDLIRLERYYLPMTEVRQLVYDADRLYYLKNKAETQEKLRLTREELVRVGQSGGESLEQAVNEALIMLEKLELAIENDPATVAETMRLLGEKINLMVLKGDLILAGAKFK